MSNLHELNTYEMVTLVVLYGRSQHNFLLSFLQNLSNSTKYTCKHTPLSLHSQQHLQRGNIHLGLLANFALRQLGRLVRQHPNALGSVEPRVLEGTPDGGIFGLYTPSSELGQGSVQLEAGRSDDAGLS